MFCRHIVLYWLNCVNENIQVAKDRMLAGPCMLDIAKGVYETGKCFFYYLP
jgi:hypothetical protein